MVKGCVNVTVTCGMSTALYWDFTDLQGHGLLLAGDIVDIKRHGKATIVEGPVQDPESQFHGRYKVQYLGSGLTYYCRADVLRRLKQVNGCLQLRMGTWAFGCFVCLGL